MRVTIDGQDYTSKAVKLTVKAGKAAVSADTKAVTLNKIDRFSEAPITLSAADSTVAHIDRAELDAASAKLLEVKDYGNGNFALTYRDSTLPASFKAATAKLSVYVLGCDSPVATMSIKVSYQ